MWDPLTEALARLERAAREWRHRLGERYNDALGGGQLAPARAVMPPADLHDWMVEPPAGGWPDEPQAPPDPTAPRPLRMRAFDAGLPPLPGESRPRPRRTGWEDDLR